MKSQVKLFEPDAGRRSSLAEERARAAGGKR